jgi:hypothetical protein
MSNYRVYLQSNEWRNRHATWLNKCDNRDLLLPWKRIGYVGGRYYPYSMHHMNREAYESRGHEEIFWHIAPVSRDTHAYWFHNVLSHGKGRVSEQEVFPTILQSCANQICRLNYGLIQCWRLIKWLRRSLTKAP